jgi:excinuclease ABC subunit C
VKELLAHFRSIDAIQLAGPQQIAEVPGVGPALARQVWEYFHPEMEAMESGSMESASIQSGSLQSMENGSPLELAG